MGGFDRCNKSAENSTKKAKFSGTQKNSLHRIQNILLLYIYVHILVLERWNCAVGGMRING